MTSWREVVSDDDIELLQSTFGGFHDGCLREIHLWSGDFVDAELATNFGGGTTARVFFQRQWPNPPAIELLFGDLVGIQILPTPRGYVPEMDAWMIREDGGILWSDIQPEIRAKGSWIKAERIWWREASEWMGEELRYGNADDLPSDVVQPRSGPSRMSRPIPGLPGQ